MAEKVLCVDDDPSILLGYERTLSRQFLLETASSGRVGLATIATRGPFAVVVADMRMPEIDGVRFLAAVKELAPQTVRMVLTGCSDQQTAIEAVNEGHVFRFLTKPCPPATLAKALTAGIEQHRLITAEKELLERTLRGSINVLTDVLALTNPVAFGRAARIRRLVRELCDRLNVEHAWQCEIAAMLSQIGCVTVPPETLEKIRCGRPLTPQESRMLAAHPAVGRDLVAKIPRLEPVAEIIAYQQKCFDGSGIPADGVGGEQLPIGARILKVALDYETLRWRGDSDANATLRMHAHREWYDLNVLAALEAGAGVDEPYQIGQVAPKDLRPPMILAEDLTSVDGVLLVSKGQEVTTWLRQRLVNFARSGRVKGPVRVFVPTESRPPARCGHAVTSESGTCP